jgi:Ca-activated chloride channel homolog
MRFETPWAFLLLLAIPWVLYAQFFRAGSAAIRFSSIRHAASSGRSLRQRLSLLPLALRLGALACLTLALARPQVGGERIREVSQGVAIEMVVDRSSTMGAEMNYGGERLNRLEVAKRVFEEFVHGTKGLDGRPNDLIGLVSFARYSETNCPLTLGHGALSRFLESIQLARPRTPEDGTAIGDALALAAARLEKAEETLAKQVQDDDRSFEVKSKVIILLTDGENNCGKRHPMDAAAQAAEWGIKIYPIGVGGTESVTSASGIFGVFKQAMGSDLDERMLTALAEETGGVYYRATDAKSLRAVYEEIDRLERSSVESLRYVNWRELFAYFAGAALLFLMLEIVLSNTVFRKIP